MVFCSLNQKQKKNKFFMFLMGSKQRSLKEIIAKNIDAIGYLEGEHVLYFMNLSPGSRIQTRM